MWGNLHRGFESLPLRQVLRRTIACARSSADRASGCGPEGRGFESRRARHHSTHRTHGRSSSPTVDGPGEDGWVKGPARPRRSSFVLYNLPERGPGAAPAGPSLSSPPPRAPPPARGGGRGFPSYRPPLLYSPRGPDPPPASPRSLPAAHAGGGPDFLGGGFRPSPLAPFVGACPGPGVLLACFFCFFWLSAGGLWLAGGEAGLLGGDNSRRARARGRPVRQGFVKLGRSLGRRLTRSPRLVRAVMATARRLPVGSDTALRLGRASWRQMAGGPPQPGPKSDVPSRFVPARCAAHGGPSLARATARGGTRPRGSGAVSAGDATACLRHRPHGAPPRGVPGPSARPRGAGPGRRRASRTRAAPPPRRAPRDRRNGSARPRDRLRRGLRGPVPQPPLRLRCLGPDIVERKAWGGAGRRAHALCARRPAGLHPFEADLFDRVVSFAVWEHIAHPSTALGETFRILRPGGLAWVKANLHRGPMASHLYAEIAFPYPHLLFGDEVIAESLRRRGITALGASWVNRLSWADYDSRMQAVGFRLRALRFTGSPNRRGFLPSIRVDPGPIPADRSRP